MLPGAAKGEMFTPDRRQNHQEQTRGGNTATVSVPVFTYFKFSNTDDITRVQWIKSYLRFGMSPVHMCSVPALLLF